MAGEEKYEKTKTTPLFQRVPYLEQQLPHHVAPCIDTLDEYPTPRVLKTHLPLRFIKRWIMEDRLKTIVTSRNPKDTLVSMFHMYQSLLGNAQMRWYIFTMVNVKGMMVYIYNGICKRYDGKVYNAKMIQW